MPNIYYLSPAEQRIMDIVKDTDIIITEDLIQAANDMQPQVIRNILSSLVKKGHLFRAKQGVYLKCEEPHLPVINNPPKIALTIFKGYIGFASALSHWDLVGYESFTIFIVTKTHSGIKEIGEYRFQAVAMGNKALGMIYDHEHEIYVSTLEKTIFDCIYKPIYAGGYPLVVKAIAEVKPDWKKVIYWFDRLGSQSLKLRGGYILEKAGNAPKRVLKHLKLNLKNNIWLDPSGIRRGKYVKEWSLMDNVGV